MTMKLVRSEFDLNNPPPLTDAQREELARLAEMKDEDIDFSDIPRLTEKFWANAIPFRDRHLYRPVKKQLTLRLDNDLIQWSPGGEPGEGMKYRGGTVLTARGVGMPSVPHPAPGLLNLPGQGEQK